MILIRTRTGGDGDIEARVLALFGGGIARGDLELFHVIRIDAEHIIGGCGIRGFIGFDAVYGDVTRLGAQSVDVDAGAATLRHPGFEDDQVQRVTSVERQGGDSLPFDNVTQGSVGGVDLFYRSFHLYDLGGTANLQGDVDREGCAYGERIAGLARLFETGRLHLDGVDSSQYGGKGVKAGIVGHLP